MRSRSPLVALALLVAGFAAPRASFLWDDTGHMVVVRIAWTELTPATRARVTSILAAAPAPAGLAQLRPPSDRPERDQMFAAYAATWPDIVRSKEPTERHAFSHPFWHFIDFYWSEGPNGTIVPSPTLAPDSVNIDTELERLSRLVADSATAPGERAVALAWLLHLGGDIHQPLHASSRVSAKEPKGDKGGNDFKLDTLTTLHWYWDAVLTRRYPREEGENDEHYVSRVAAHVMAANPRRAFAARLADTSYAHWTAEALRLAEHQVYCCGVTRGALPSESYLAHADSVAEPQIAVAGYRLAALLERLLGR